MEQYDVIIVGGSYAGLAAAMSLGRSLRNVLVIDSGMPCNRQTPHSHNFITQDGETPSAVAAKARKQVEAYPTVQLLSAKVTEAEKQKDGFVITTDHGDHITCAKLLFATGIHDIMPDIIGYADCWGISVIHCPYCHGYEVRGKKLGVVASGDMAIEYVRLIHQLSKDLVLFTNGPANLKTAHREKLSAHRIPVIETTIKAIKHEAGFLQDISLEDGTSVTLEALFSRPAFRQHCDLPEQLGCLLTQAGYLHADEFGKTNVPGVFVAGDNSTMMRSLAAASAAGNKTGAWINKELAEERF